MLQKIKDIFKRRKEDQEKARLTEVYKKNKDRFELIHTDKRFNYLHGIYERLLTDDKTLTDNEILNNYQKFSKSIQTNTFGGAELELVSISTICHFRPHLTQALIRQALLLIVWSLGDDIDHAVVRQFIDRRILANDIEPYGGLPHEKGIEWLKNVLPGQAALIQKTLEEVIDQNNRELEGQNNSR